MKVNVCLPGNHLEAIVRNYVQLLYYSLSDLGHTVAISSNYIDSSMFNIIFDPLYAVQSQRDYFEGLMKSDVLYGFQSVEMFTGNGFGYHHFPFTAEELGFLAALLERSKFVWTAFRDEFDCYRQITNKVQYIRYGYHEKMEEVCRSREKLIDVFFFGSPDAAGRNELLDGLRTAGLGVVVQPTGGTLLTRNSLIGASRINLNLSHHFPYRHASPNRLVFLANNGICAVSTAAVDP